MRAPLMAGNWKMHNNVRESVNLVEDLYKQVSNVKDREILVCPVFTSLYPVSKALENTNIKMGAQDLFWEEKGAFTGEVSPGMIKDVGCAYVIIGHSERRAYFGETNETVNKKVKAAFSYGLNPIVCVGESLELREKGDTQKFVKGQIREGLKELIGVKIENLVIAYEPIWAIGTGKTDTPEGANDIIKMIRAELADIFTEEAASKIRILYGGSVKPDNIDAFMATSDIDGALVGGASLNADSFARIVKYQ
ncbi:MAG: triose-phosphate isomerase [Armatimonadota bacterium]